MRITREALLKTAAETAEQRASSERGVVCIYLIGSLLAEHPLLGGTTDIDLVIVHTGEPVRRHEIVRLSPEVTLDIAHHTQTTYHQPRSLRVDPWLGPAIYNHPVLLHDTQHWFDFAQSSVGAQFNRPDYVMARARHQAESARQIWLSLQSGGALRGSELSLYLKALEAAVNAIASLSGSPLTERRFLLAFPERAEAQGRSGLTAGLLGLLGANETDAGLLRSWLPAWEACFQAAGAQEGHPVRLDPARLLYYRRAIEAMIDGDQPEAAVWPLLTTWTSAAGCLPAGADQINELLDACRHLRLDKDNFDERLSGLDAYLDSIEETLDVWAQEYGA
jgi:hypothetical protein